MNTKKMSLASLAFLCLFALAACDKPGPAEEAGKKIDAATKKVGDKMDETYDKATEKTSKAEAAVEDGGITTSIKGAFLAEPSLESFDIKVDTVNQVVTLTGFVATHANRDKAAEIAAAEADVMQVNNQIVVD